MSESVYDLIIIGGGISGAGIALESSKHGLKTLLLEKEQLFKAASGNNLRIIHGGYRYLQTASFKRIKESIKAQNSLLKDYPEYIKRLHCLLPLNKRGMKSTSPVIAANLAYSTLYRLYTGNSCGNKILSASVVEKEVELLKGKCPYGALLWHDAIVEDLGAFHAHLLKELLSASVQVQEGCSADEVSKDGSYLKVRAGGKEFLSKNVVNSSGAWLDKIKISLPQYSRKKHKWCKAFNLILNRKVESKYTIGIESKLDNSGKRLYFIVPRNDSTVIGTEYTEFDSSLNSLTVSEIEKQEFINNVNLALPLINLKTSDISRVEVGVLPYLHSGKRGYVLQGKEKIYNFGNYFEILSTKYTTFRSQATAFIKMLQNVK